MSPPTSLLELPRRAVLTNPASVLTLLGASAGRTVTFRESFVAEIWAITGIAALARSGGSDRCAIDLSQDSNGARFATAVGLTDVVAQRSPVDWGEPGRTVKLRQLSVMQEIEPVASQISALIAPSDEVARATLYYVIVELLRNVVQHSGDPLGAVVAAQSMTVAQQYDRPAVQVAVADTGVGIPRHLQSQHRGIADAGEALEKALRAHISGTFAEGLSGSEYNAGFGLFAISELAKLTGGRLLVASRGAALSIHEDRADPSHHGAEIVMPAGTGYPGTLVAFELPLGEIRDFGALMEEVRKRAKIQTPARTIHRWIKYEPPPEGTRKILVKIVRENTEEAGKVSRGIKTSLLAGDPIALDFSEISFVTQSFLHALLFNPLRIAWAERQPVYVTNATPAVRSALEMLEEYALGG